jgi:hypothetical protein
MKTQGLFEREESGKSGRAVHRRTRKEAAGTGHKIILLFSGKRIYSAVRRSSAGQRRVRRSFVCRQMNVLTAVAHAFSNSSYRGTCAPVTYHEKEGGDAGMKRMSVLIAVLAVLSLAAGTGCEKREAAKPAEQPAMAPATGPTSTPTTSMPAAEPAK